ncbi:Protein VACUOLELESS GAMETOPHYTES [Cardamine amara subsp. amara]|uniref:Protein VACUOLELESS GAMETOPHYTES n=1 Tax=Cardamine amara subsp. amara TaxID=228776 RepID=A0ABD1A1T8_CARAN
MDSVGGFQLPKYHPIPETQTQSPTPSADAATHNHPLLLCPLEQWASYTIKTKDRSSSDEYTISTTSVRGRPVLPLFWCNNKEFDSYGDCDVCRGSKFGTDYYFCELHHEKFHKECVESPLKIKHPYHPEHYLQLHFLNRITECFSCRRKAEWLVYRCTICQFFMHPVCAMKPISFVVDQPKRHHHSLTFFPRQTSLTCNVCGLLRKLYPTYVCLGCNFVAHNDCMYSPSIIKISRHHHRISYISSLRSGEWSCGVCRQGIDGDYGAYSCDKCSDYVVHSRCALGEDVWDGKELEGVPEEAETTLGPFNVINEGVISHFLHAHYLRFEVNILDDENNFCQACALSIYEGNFYSCMECDFVIHETCAIAPPKIQSALHPHPLILKADTENDCNACARTAFGGFGYKCPIRECDFKLDVLCASISEPFDYKGHDHPLFLGLDPEEKAICHVCKTKFHKPLNCIKCDFIVCMKCATLPNKVKYKHDKHFLTILFGEEVCENDWCEVCERHLGDTDTKVFYWCKECCTTFHIECLFGKDPYMKPGKIIRVWGLNDVQILGKCKISRPICDHCKNRCQGKMFKRDNYRACSWNCMYWTFYM